VWHSFVTVSSTFLSMVWQPLLSKGLPEPKPEKSKSFRSGRLKRGGLVAGEKSGAWDKSGVGNPRKPYLRPPDERQGRPNT